MKKRNLIAKDLLSKRYKPRVIKPKKNRGSAIFIHLTKNYKKTAGCIALTKKNFLILAKLVNKNSKIIIN